MKTAEPFGGTCKHPDMPQSAAPYASSLLPTISHHLAGSSCLPLQGSMMFAFIGSASLYVATVALTSEGTIPPNIVMAALANGFMLAVASAPSLSSNLSSRFDRVSCSTMPVH